MTSVLVLLLLLLLLFFNLSSLTWCCLIFTSESVMPAKATLFNIKCESLFDFGTGPRNDVFYNPHGNNILKRDMLSRISGKSVILNWYFYLTIFNITTIGHNYCYYVKNYCCSCYVAFLSPYFVFLKFQIETESDHQSWTNRRVIPPFAFILNLIKVVWWYLLLLVLTYHTYLPGWVWKS